MLRAAPAVSPQHRHPGMGWKGKNPPSLPALVQARGQLVSPGAAVAVADPACSTVHQLIPIPKGGTLQRSWTLRSSVGFSDGARNLGQGLQKASRAWSCSLTLVSQPAWMGNNHKSPHWAPIHHPPVPHTQQGASPRGQIHLFGPSRGKTWQNSWGTPT